MLLKLELGYHPWFTHCITLRSGSSLSKEEHYMSLFQPKDPEEIEAFTRLCPLLPEPIPLDKIIENVRTNLESFPHAMLGEVGLDRSFRIPVDYYTTPREITPFSVPIDHQLKILEAQFDLAVELSRNISLHSVKSPQHTFELLNRMAVKYGERWKKISVDLHSCGLSSQMLRDLQVKRATIYVVSF